MEQKTKFIIIGLIAITALSVIFLIGSLGSKQALERERDDLKKENIALNSQLDKFQGNLRGYENKIGALNKQLEDLGREKDDLNKKYELANKAKEELADKLKSVSAQRPAASQELPAGTDAYWANIVKQKTDLEIQLESLRRELKTMQINNEQLQRDKGALELDINNFRHETEDLKRQLDYNKKLMDSLAQDLVREKNDKIQIQDSFRSVKNENTILTRQLKSLNSKKANLERKLQDFNDDKAALQRRIDELEVVFKEKVNQANNLDSQMDAVNSAENIEMPIKKESVVLPPIIVRPSNDASVQDNSSGLEGKIKALNRENNFVVIDLGEDNEIKIGDSFRVFREDKHIADIVVIQTRRGISACDIKKEIEPIKIGDTVR